MCPPVTVESAVARSAESARISYQEALVIESQTNHPLVETTIRCLVPGDAESLDLLRGDVTNLRKVIRAMSEPSDLATVAEELLTLAVNLDRKRKSPRTADIVAGLANEAALRSMDLRRGLSGQVDRAVDLGERYQKFADRHERFRDRRNEKLPSGETFRVDALDPKRRV